MLHHFQRDSDKRIGLILREKEGLGMDKMWDLCFILLGLHGELNAGQFVLQENCTIAAALEQCTLLYIGERELMIQ